MAYLYSPKKGQHFNPLTAGKYRNLPCPCGSYGKVKKCHGLFETLDDADYITVKRWIREVVEKGGKENVKKSQEK